MDLHEENIYKVKAENLMAENHALKEENNDILQRLKAAEDLSKQQKTEMSLLKAEIKALKEVKNFEIRGFRKKMEEKISKIRKSRNSSSNNESITETQINQHNPLSPTLTHLKPQFNWQTSPSGQHQFENASVVDGRGRGFYRQKTLTRTAYLGSDSTEAKTSGTAKIKTKEEELDKFFKDLLEKSKRKAIQRRKASSGYSKRTVTCGEDKGLCSHRFIIDRSIPYII